jgi:capsular exopolysaccharide synthesis family protein
MKKIELIAEEQNNYFMREAFNTLSTNILFSGRDVKTIVVTSCMAHEGKTTISYETSRSLAESGKRVLLVDADLRKSVMASRLTKERGITGLSQLLSGQITMEQAIYNTQVEGLDIIFAGPYPPNPTELVGSTAFKELMQAQRDNYDYIIVDAPPLGLVIDAAVMASTCDGAVIVINTGHIKYRTAQSVNEQLEKSGCKILGVVMNQIDRKKNLNHSDSYYSSQYGSGYYAYESHSNQKSVRPDTSDVKAQPKKK